MSTYCRNENCGEDDGDYLDDRGVRNVPIRELSQKRQDSYNRRQPEIEAEMLQLSEDASSWRDSADWVDNCGRIRDCLRHLPDMIEELRDLRKKTTSPHDPNGAFLG